MPDHAHRNSQKDEATRHLIKAVIIVVLGVPNRTAVDWSSHVMNFYKVVGVIIRISGVSGHLPWVGIDTTTANQPLLEESNEIELLDNEAMRNPISIYT